MKTFLRIVTLDELNIINFKIVNSKEAAATVESLGKLLSDINFFFVKV